MQTPHARFTDPAQCDEVVKSLVEDGSYKALVIAAVLANHVHGGWTGVTDDMIWDWIEQATRRRHQRNVIARTRGILEHEEVLIRQPDRVVGGTHRVAVAHREWLNQHLDAEQMRLL